MKKESWRTKTYKSEKRSKCKWCFLSYAPLADAQEQTSIIKKSV